MNWRIELRRKHLVVVSPTGKVMERIVRVGKDKHSHYAAVENFHALRWGPLHSGQAFELEARTLAAFIAGVKAGSGTVT